MKRCIALILLICLAVSTACKASELTHTRITAEQAMQMMQDAEEFVLLDVRTYDEFRERRLDGALLIPYDEIGRRAMTDLPDKNALILIYCRLGRRSEIAANELISMGYTRVYDLGGIETGWMFDTVSG